MSLEEAALVEPTAVAIHACRRAGVSLGKVVLVGFCQNIRFLDKTLKRYCNI